MTVSELIEELRKYDGDMLVMYNYDDGYDYSAPQLEIQTVFYDPKKEHYQGEHYKHDQDVECIEVLAIY